MAEERRDIFEQAEQAARVGELSELAGYVRAYYSALFRAGFSPEEAFTLARDWHASQFGPCNCGGEHD